MRRLAARRRVYPVECDACLFGLGPPDDPGARYKKGTYLLDNLPEPRWLGRRCRGRCRRVHLEGAVRVDGRWQKWAALAAAYAPQFAKALANALRAAVRRLAAAPLKVDTQGLRYL